MKVRLDAYIYICLYTFLNKGSGLPREFGVIKISCLLFYPAGGGVFIVIHFKIFVYFQLHMVIVDDCNL